ncbi:hypothetical protein GCM10022381_27460 [Leifsonia kafniensis]|uniref:DUF4190 domain-containing protein n=1 Tax=Leifsonia kafniensis TaxID=475957 RepID=A0ABP7KNG9_9MICO
MSYPAQSEFTQPQFEQRPESPAPQSPVGGLAIAALIVGGSAFVLGWMIGVGFVLGLAGIVLGILALRTTSGRVFGVIGLVLSAIATLTNIVAMFVFAVFLGGSLSLFADGVSAEFGDAQSALTFAPVSTPCYGFDGPAHYVNNLPEADVAACASRLELWGEVTPDGEVLSTGVGAIFGTVGVEPIRVQTSDAMTPADTVDEMVQALSLDYLPAMGTVESLLEPITLDGVAANLTRIDSDAEFTELKAVITARAPAAYQTANGPVQYFVISVVLPDEVGQTDADEERILSELISTWTWQ